jgi:Ca-activated chloride channel family protein
MDEPSRRRSAAPPCPRSLTETDTVSRLVASVQIQNVPHAEHQIAAALAAALAVNYQLVTDHTNFLLVHERADADKAIDMPALHKVRTWCRRAGAALGR